MPIPKDAEEQRQQQWEQYEKELNEERRPRFYPASPGMSDAERKKWDKIIAEVEEIKKRLKVK